MKKVHFLVACCLVVCLALGGCAKDEPPLEAPAETDASPEMPAEEEKPAEPEVPVEAPVEAEETPVEETQANAELHGIIALVYTPMYQYDILSIDPDNGKTELLSTFATPLTTNDDEYSYQGIIKPIHYGNYHEIFSPDYSKMISSQVSRKTGETHAGWITTDGVFFDVTATLYPELNNGFSDTPLHVGAGFTSDGCFIYNDNNFREGSSFYSVPIDNLAPEMIKDFSWEDGTNNGCLSSESQITCQLDDTRYLVNYAEWGLTSKIYDSASGEFVDYIPESERTNWGAVVSPDTQKIAFLSRPHNGVNIELFVTSPSGGEPTMVNMEQTLDSLYGKLEANATYDLPWCTLLDWR